MQDRLEQKVLSLINFYQPQKDGLVDSYRILTPESPYGDCDDFSITVAFMESDCSYKEMFLNILKGKIKLYRTYTESNEKHLVCWVEGKGFIDNRYLRYSQSLYYGYEIRYEQWFIMVILKFMIGLFK